MCLLCGLGSKLSFCHTTCDTVEYKEMNFWTALIHFCHFNPYSTALIRATVTAHNPGFGG
jgi:hypothetical protein